jgi:uncharacterized protein (DUF362 family)
LPPAGQGPTGKVPGYDGPIKDTVLRGLVELGFDRRRVSGLTVLLKPNLVEPAKTAPHINTHPLFVQAVAAAFRSLDAKEVLVAEGQGHVRDTALVLEQSGLEPILDHERLEFVDLNHDELFARRNALGLMKIRQLMLPATLRRADLIVSLPKMKTHHWAGVTLSMKNFFGVMPGIFYGWPKNVLHQCGIEQSILDINATVRPHLAIVDGIVGMDGDGPIMGDPKQTGVVVMGADLPATDATATRIMGLEPMNLIQFRGAEEMGLGIVRDGAISQRGEDWRQVVQPYRYPDNPHYQRFLKPPGAAPGAGVG